MEGEPIDLTEKELQVFAESEGISTVAVGLNYTFSQLAFQSTILVLLDKISQGDYKAIFKTITVDKSLLYNEDVKKRMTEAQLKVIESFFLKLAEALFVTVRQKKNTGQATGT